MKLFQSPILLAVLTVLVVSACSPKDAVDAKTTGTTGPTNGGKKLTVGVVFDSGGVGDNSFNDSAKAGLDRAEKELGITPKTVSSQSASDYPTNLEAMASGGCDVVFAVGLNQQQAVADVAPKYPNVKFAIVDGEAKGPNIRCLKFEEEQGSFLVGYLAGEMTQTKKIGFVGGQELDLIKKFYAGYAAGAKTADKSVEVLPAKYVGSWDDQLGAKAIAEQLYGSGADIIYHAAGRAGGGVFTAAQEQKKYAIGVDGDQDGLAPGLVLTSMIKHVDEAVYQTIKDVQAGKFQAGDKIYDLASKGVGMSDMKYTKDKIGQAKLDKVNQVAADIISGKIKVPATLDQLDAYVKNLK